MIKKILELVQNGGVDPSSGVKIINQLKKYDEFTVKQSIFSDQFNFNEPCLKGHLVFDNQILLGVTYISLAFNAFYKFYSKECNFTLHKVTFLNPAIVNPDETLDVDIFFEKNNDKIIVEASLNHTTELSNKLAMKGLITFETAKTPIDSFDIDLFKKNSHQLIDGDKIYSKLTNIVYTTPMQSFKNVHIQGNESLSYLEVSNDILDDGHQYNLHPSLLDGALLGAVASLISKQNELNTYIPLFIKKVTINETPSIHCWSKATIIKSTEELLEADISLFNDNGHCFATLEGVSYKRLRNPELLLPNNLDQPTLPSSLNKSTLSPVSPQDIQGDSLLEKIETYVVAKIKQAIDEPEVTISLNKNFMELGIDSNKLIEIANDIESEIGIELYPTLFFEYQCIHDLSQYFFEEYSHNFTQYLNIPEPFAPNHTEKEGHDEYIQEADTAATKDQPVFTPSNNSSKNSDIAIIGMSATLPGSKNLHEFWKHLDNKTNLIKEIPQDHFDYKPWYSSTQNMENSLYSKWGSFIDDVDKFDSEFFGFVAREADVMDPQLRHLLQVLYHTTEDAGYINSIRGSNTGMFVGACFHDYQTEMIYQKKPIEVYDGIGNSPTMLANRPSFYFDLKGPSFTIDTACSSSLVAIHQACKAIQNGECDMAFASGVNLLLTPGHYAYFCRLGALSKTGRCHTFDKRADGYVPGEGIAAILLKPLSEALKDGDQIHGIIKGSSVRHSGYTSTITAPSVTGEVSVIKNAWKDANIDPKSISYIEAHGTGTPLGDPIELQAIQKSFSEEANNEFSCYVGSAKAHLGHLEGAAGIVGVIKVLLSMKHQQIPAMPDFKDLNPLVKMSENMIINTATIPWKTSDYPRRAGVNSFGFGGAFAHVVLEEYIPPEQPLHQTIKNPASFLMVFSARNAKDLTCMAQNMLSYLKTCSDENQQQLLSNISYTLQVGRDSMEHRLTIITHSIADFVSKLEQLITTNEPVNHCLKGTRSSHETVTDLFNKDKALQASFQTYFSENTPKLSNIASLWVKGFDINWKLLYQQHLPNIISLPGYPFAKHSHWFFKRNQQNIDLKECVSVESQPEDFTWINSIQTGYQHLEKFSIQRLLDILNDIHFFQFLSSEKPTSFDKIMKHFNITQKYQPLLQQILTILKNESILSINDQQILLLNVDLSKESSKTLENILHKDHPELSPYVTLLNQCLTHFFNVISGKITAAEVLFTSESVKLIEKIYKDNIISDYFNIKIGNYIKNIIEQKLNTSSDTQITILEIGAGTGGTTQTVLNYIAPFSDKLTYIYSDISRAFKTYADTFKQDYPFVEFNLINIEQDDVSQNKDIKADIILASNVLHATTDITHTLLNASSFLKDSGVLILNEITQYQHFLTLTFGLMDGWWLYNDAQLRIPGSPLLSEANWVSTLEQCGFDQITVFEQPFEGQHIISCLNVKKNRPEKLKNNIKQHSASTKKTIEVTLTKDIQPVQDIVVSETAMLLNISPRDIDVNEKYLTLGIDSITGVDLIGRLNKTFSSQIDVSTIMDYPTIATLSSYIASSIETSSKVLPQTHRFDRFNVNHSLAKRLKDENKLVSKMEIDKLFEKDIISEVSTEESLFTFFKKDEITVDFISQDDVKLEVIQSGTSKETILLCPPLNTLATIWHHQYRFLAKKYRLITIHYPGFGRSEFSEKFYNIPQIATLLYKTLNTLKISKPIHLVGWSMGGLIVQSIAEQYPEIAKSVTLIGTGSISMFDDNYYNEHIHVKKAIIAEMDAANIKKEALLDEEKYLVATFNTEVLIHYATKIRDFDHTCFRNIKAPVLILNGKKDRVLHPKYAKELINNFPLAAYKEIKNGGHFLAVTHPHLINKHLQQFFAKGKAYLNNKTRSKQGVKA
ncbi:hypothetical protein DID76_01545 [Candidatus Marinamargulisbacteria bacterium SCGC AG-414-C22]|nr:hypothetical protein DID76_01545 [Candidatus Marinamargulisbacteria bacterium SCGC AG-414-C22]